MEETREDYYLYRGYLLVQRTGDNVEYLNAYVWDPTEPINTRLLYYVIPGPELIFCGHDFNKNVTELFHYDIHTEEQSRTYYDYTPYGLMNGEGEQSDSNPFCFSNEYLDQELGLVYYNYRHYNPIDGRWISRDLLEERYENNLYSFTRNNSNILPDFLGLTCDYPVSSYSLTIQFYMVHSMVRMKNQPKAGMYIGTGSVSFDAKCSQDCKSVLLSKVEDGTDIGWQIVGDRNFVSIELKIVDQETGSYKINYEAGIENSSDGATIGGVVGVLAGLIGGPWGSIGGAVVGGYIGLKFKWSRILTGSAGINLTCNRGNVNHVWKDPSPILNEEQTIRISEFWKWPRE